MHSRFQIITIGLVLLVSSCSNNSSDTSALNLANTTVSTNHVPSGPDTARSSESSQQLNVGAVTTPTDRPGIPTIADTTLQGETNQPKQTPTPNTAPTTGSGTGQPDTTTSATIDFTCPNGLTSDLPLILDGQTVPGDLAFGLATSPEIQRNPCGTPEEQACFAAVNDERQTHNLAPYIWDGDLADLGRSHSADMKQLDYFSHGSSTTTQHLYQERGERIGLKADKFDSVVELIATNNSGGRATVQLFMGSPDHRAVILGEGGWSNITHMACGRDQEAWTIEFAW